MSLSFKEAEALETETKLFEDLEFQQLEQQSRVEEERELAGQGLLRNQAELLRSVARRKVRAAPCGPLLRGVVHNAGCGVVLEASDRFESQLMALRMLTSPSEPQSPPRQRRIITGFYEN